MPVTLMSLDLFKYLKPIPDERAADLCLHQFLVVVVQCDVLGRGDCDHEYLQGREPKFLTFFVNCALIPKS